MWVYLNGEFKQKNEASLSLDDRGFIFGDGVYEVILAFNGNLFEADAHLKRLKRSLRELRMPFPDLDAFKSIPAQLLKKNHLTDGEATVYIQITRGAAPRKHAFPPADTPPMMYASASPFEAPAKEWETGVKVVLTPDIRWMRCDIKTTSLVPNVMASQKAKETNAKEAIFVRDGAITEGSHTSFAAVFDGVFITYPECHYILPGITRKVVLDLCGKMGIPVNLFPIMQDELLKADECMLLGTTTEVMPVVQVDDQIIGEGKPGPVTLKLQKALRELIRG